MKLAKGKKNIINWPMLVSGLISSFGLIFVLYLNSPLRYSSYIEKCVKNYDLSPDVCKNFYIGAKNDKNNSKENVTQEQGKIDFVKGCAKNANNKYCNCVFDNLAEKYGYVGYLNLNKQLADSILQGEFQVEAKEYLDYLAELKGVCSL